MIVPSLCSIERGIYATLVNIALGKGFMGKKGS
jgi:hypothetical protein